MSNYNWNSTISGYWGTKGNWVQDAVPNSTLANVTIATGYQVVISTDETFTADSVTLDEVGVTLRVGGMLNLVGAKDQLLIEAGSVYITANPERGGQGGEIENGTINAGTGAIRVSNGAGVSNITFKGSIEFGGAAAYGAEGSNFAGYLHALDSTGSTIDVEGYRDTLYISDQTLDDIGINLGGSYGAGDQISFGSLGLGSGTTLNSSANGYASYLFGAILTNAGVINVTGGGLEVEVNSFVNAGTVNVSAGSYMDIAQYIPGGRGEVLAAGTIELSAGTLANLDGITLIGNGLLVIDDLNLGGATLAAAGTDNIEIIGTISNGTIDPSLGTLGFKFGATLDDITVRGDLNLTYAMLGLMGSLNVESASGSGPGTINIYGGDSWIEADGNATLDNVGINLNSGAALISGIGNLTLGSQATVNSNRYFNEFSGGYIFNDGRNTIAGDIVNDGTVNVITGGLAIVPGTFTNAGIINVSAGAVLALAAGSFSNKGEINAAGEVEVGYEAYPYEDRGSTTLANLGEISLTGGGLLLVVSGVSLNLGGGTLKVGGTDNIEIDGTVGNGVINPSLGTLTLGNDATLNDITYKGNLNLTASSQELYITGGLHVENASGGPGTINITGDDARLVFKDSETLDNVRINLGAAGQQSDDRLNAGTGNSLTLGNQAVVDSNGTSTNSLYGSAIVNAGIINVAGKALQVHAGKFTNEGTINIAGGSRIGLDSATTSNDGMIESTGNGVAHVNVKTGAEFTNISGTTLTSGGFEANAHDTLALNLNGAIVTTDDGQLILVSAGSEIEQYQSASSTYLSLESTLETIGSGGTLKVLATRGYSTHNTLDISGGELVLGGGTFSAAALDLTDPGSRLNGHGTIASRIENAGAIYADIGTLVIDGPLSGAGALHIDSSSTLQLITGTSETVIFAGTGSRHSALILDAPSLFAGTLGGLASGDVIDLAGDKVKTATISGSSLLVTLTNNSTLDYALASTLPSEGVSISSDGGTGSDLTFYQLPAAPAFAPAVMSNYNWKSGVSGDWGTAGDWVQNIVPNSSTADVTISSASAIEVKINPGQSFTADSVTLDSVGVSLKVLGLLNLGGAEDQMVISAGKLDVAGGTIANGTIIAGTEVVTLGRGATLDDIAFKGNLNLIGNCFALYSTGGLRGLSPAGGSTINVIGIDARFDTGAEVIDNVGINLGSASRSGGVRLAAESGDVLTLGSHATIHSNGVIAYSYGRPSSYNYIYGNGVINNGVIDVVSGGLMIKPTAFTNAGTINVSAGSTLVLGASSLSNTGEIDAAGTIVLDGNQTLANLGSFSLAGDGLFIVNNSLNLGGGTLKVGDVEIVGLVSDGTIDTGLGTLSFGYVAPDEPTLDDITLRGNLNITGGYEEVTSIGGLKVENASGGSGTINITGPAATLFINDNETLDNVGINLGGASQSSRDGLRASGTLTLGGHATVGSQGAGQNYLYGNFIVNDGIINVAGVGLIIDLATFINAGTINVSAGSALKLDAASWSNPGMINAAGTVYLEGDGSPANLGEISLTGDGLLDVTGSLNLGGGTLKVGGTGNIEIDGTVSNGSINTNLGVVSFGETATLNDITSTGNLNLTGYDQVLFITGGLTVENSSGSGPGLINLIGYQDSLQANGILDNVGITLGDAGQRSKDQLVAATLGAHATVYSNGIYLNDLSGASMLNDGIIDVAGKGLLVEPGVFTNAGTINVGAGSYLLLDSSSIINSGLIASTGSGTASVSVSPGTNFQNLSGTTLTGGSFEANPSATLLLNLNGAVITTDDSTLILNGGEIESYQSATHSYVALESTLETIGSGGTLELLGGRGYSTGNTLAINGGKLQLSGGIFAAASLNLSGPGSHVIGFGTIDGPISNTGGIYANGGTLIIAGSLTGAGALKIDQSSTLELSTGTSETVTFAGTGATHSKLVLHAPASFTGTLGGLAAGDGIELIGVEAETATISGTSLLVTLTNTTVLDYTLATSLPLEGVRVIDGDNNSDLKFYQLPAAPAPAMQFISPPAAATPAPATSLPALRELWLGGTNYRPSFVAHSGHVSFTNPQNLQAELGNMPTPTNAGIVLPGQLNWEWSRSPYQDLARLPLKG